MQPRLGVTLPLLLLACGQAPSASSDAAVTDPGAPLPPASEIVARMARLLWQGDPDPATIARATARAPLDRSKVATLAREMLGDSRARAGVAAFARFWLELDDLSGLDKDRTMFPDWNAALRADMLAETEAFVTDVTLDGDARFATLMAGRFTFANQRLAAFYGIPDVTGPDLRRVAHATPGRAGVLGHAGVIAVRSRPDRTFASKRGNFVYRRLLCKPLLNADITDPIAPDRPMREQLVQATAAPSCQTCHALMNPIGFAFEHFDSIGRWRDTDVGFPVDATGALPAKVFDPAPAFDGQPELAHVIVATGEGPRCFARQWLWFALDRERKLDDAAIMAPVEQAFVDARLDLRALIVAVVTSPHFVAP